MKNKVLLIPIIIVITTLVTGILIVLFKDNSDNKQFEKDYGEHVPKGTNIIYLTDDSVIKELSTNDKLVFLGNTSSVATKQAIKTLLSKAEDNGIDMIYYYDTKDILSKEIIGKTLKEKLRKEKIVFPTLFLLKNKQVAEIKEGIDGNLEEDYEEVMISYIMCNNPDC